MSRPLLQVVLASLLCWCSLEAAAQDADFETVLRFEGPQPGETPHGWGGGPAGTIFFDSTTVYSGSGAAHLVRMAGSPGTFTTITKSLEADFEGESIELRGVLRTSEVTGYAGLWMREDGRSGVLQFDNMYERGLKGTTDWTEHAVRLPLDPKARQIFFGVLVQGEGEVWADELQLLVDGKPVGQASKREVEPTILNTDREFEDGSGIELTSLTPRQIEHVAVLGNVWGFLKYHHPRVAAGEIHWDYELLRVLPNVLSAGDSEDRNRILSNWIERLGVPEDCEPCAQPAENTHLQPRLDWIDDMELLGETMSAQLRSIYLARPAGGEQFYVDQVMRVGNPIFEQEPAYAELQPPDTGYRLLSLLRLWNIIEYWFPYRDVIDDDWDAVLREFIPRLAEAGEWDDYRLELLALISRIQDTHANLWSALDVRPPRGSCYWPVALRHVEHRFTVAAYTHTDSTYTPVLEVGDVILAADGVPVDSLVAEWAPFYAASNQTTRLRDIARSMPRGACGQSRLTIERDGEVMTLDVPHLSNIDRMPLSHDRPGDTFQLLSPEVAYLKLSSVKATDVNSYIERAAGTRGMVIDIRNYPSEFMVFDLGSRLIEEPTAIARFTRGDLANPGAFVWTDPIEIEPQLPAYSGKVVVLVDETSMSQAEYTAMALRAGPRSVVVGSTTAGADGNVSRIPLPGGLQTMISGIGVFYPDKTPTQRIGIVPDIKARPTAEGIREGRDEVLEAAIRHILGVEADAETIVEMARRPAL